MMVDGFRYCACRVFGCVVYVFRAGGRREVVRCALRSFVRSVFLRGSWCSDYGGTMGGRDVPIISAFPMKYADQVRGVSRRVMPVPGCSAEIDMRIDFRCGGCSRPNFSKSVYSFAPTVFFYKFSRLFLSVRVVKSQNEFETKALASSQVWCHMTRKWCEAFFFRGGV